MTDSKKRLRKTPTTDGTAFEILEISTDCKDGQYGNFLGTLGLCAGAGRMIFGAPMICEALRRHRADQPSPVAVVVASDVSENTRTMLRNKCEFYGRMFVVTDITMARLSAAVGKKADIAAVGITDYGFLKALKLK